MNSSKQLLEQIVNLNPYAYETKVQIPINVWDSIVDQANNLLKEMYSSQLTTKP